MLAPDTNDLRADLIVELSQYLGISNDEAEARLADAACRFTIEWRQRVADASNEDELIRFYNESQTEIFDLVQWHATDSIHYRSLIALDIASRSANRTMVDYGSGIGSDALAFAESGFHVTLADVSSPLLAFARWRCERRGHRVDVIDLKQHQLEPKGFGVALCFDVLEHIPRPLKTLRAIQRSLVTDGLLFVHAPFGEDPERPMHVVHRDVMTPRMRAIGFNWRADLESAFPDWLWAPRVYEASAAPISDRLGYYVHDVLMPGPVGTKLASLYRRLKPRRSRTVTST
jgi:SAM-dependent methyltransferase